MSYQNTPENGAEKEILSAEHEKLRSMILNLNRVDAPKDFNFALKAKIAEAQKHESRRSAFLPVLRYAAPLCLLVLFGGFVVFNLFFSTGASEIPQVAEVKTAAPKIDSAPENPAIPIENSPETAANLKKEEIADVPKNDKKIVLNNSSIIAGKSKDAPTFKDEENEFRGTRESALKESRIIFPNGIDPNKKVVKPEDFTVQSQHKISDILRQIGIETDANWQIKSVKANSLADRSGVKTGDVIEAVDNQKLTAETIFAESSTGRTLHLLRGGKKIAAELGKP